MKKNKKTSFKIWRIYKKKRTFVIQNQSVMKTFKITKQNLPSCFRWLEKWGEKEISKNSIQKLKDEVFESFVNMPDVHFSTSGDYEVTIWDGNSQWFINILYNEKII